MEYIPIIMYLVIKFFSAVIIAFNLDIGWFAFGLRSRARHFRRFTIPRAKLWATAASIAALAAIPRNDVIHSSRVRRNVA